MATTFYLRHTTATGVVPNAKQSADTITNDFASSIATYANPADMTTSAGSTNSVNTGTGTGGETQHYSHYGTWVSPPLGTQTISGTVTIGLSMVEGNAKQNNYPRVKIYRWLADDTKGTDLLLATSATEVPNTTTYALDTFWSAQAITSVDFVNGDRLVIEIEDYNTNVPTEATNRAHGLQFGGAAAGTYGSYITFNSVTITMATVQTPKTLSKASVSVGTVRRATTKTLSKAEAALRTLAKAATRPKSLSLTEVAGRTISQAIIFAKSLTGTEASIGTIDGEYEAGSVQKGLSGTMVSVPASTREYGEVQRKTDGDFAEIAKVPWADYAYQDNSGFTSGVTYYYRIRKVINGVAGDWSNIDSVLYELIIPKTISGISTSVPTLKKSVGKLLDLIETTASTLRRSTVKLLTYLSVSVSTLSQDLYLLIAKSLSYSVTSVSLLRRSTGKVIAYIETTSTTVLSQVTKGLAGISVSVPAVNVSVEKVLDYIESSSITILTQINKSLLAIEVAINTFGKETYKSLSVTEVSVSLLRRQTGKVLDIIEVTARILRRNTGKLLDVSSISIPAVRRGIVKVLEQTSTSVNTLRRSVTKLLSKAESSIVSVLHELIAVGVEYKTLTLAVVSVNSVRRQTGKVLDLTSVSVNFVRKTTAKILDMVSAGLGLISYIPAITPIQKTLSVISSFITRLFAVKVPLAKTVELSAFTWEITLNSISMEVTLSETSIGRRVTLNKTSRVVILNETSREVILEEIKI